MRQLLCPRELWSLGTGVGLSVRLGLGGVKALDPKSGELPKISGVSIFASSSLGGSICFRT